MTLRKQRSLRWFIKNLRVRMYLVMTFSPTLTKLLSSAGGQACKTALPLQAPVPTTWSIWEELTRKWPSPCSKGGNDSGSLPNKVCMCVYVSPLWYWAIFRNVNCEGNPSQTWPSITYTLSFFPQCFELVSAFLEPVLKLALKTRLAYIFLGIYFQTLAEKAT